MARGRNDSHVMSRRNFARLLAVGGSAAVIPAPALAWRNRAPLPPTPAEIGEAFWDSVREQFVLSPDLAIMNAANLCPSSAPVLDSLYANTKDMDHDPSFNNREKMSEGKETTRKILADFLRVTPDEIVITRNTSEGSNIVSSGLELKAGDEVVIFEDNHPSNNEAWQEKSKRFGFTVTVIPQVNPYPGPEHYIDAFTKAIGSRTRVIAFTHLTSTVGDPFPAKELCRLARERGVLSHLDGAQTFGLLDVDLSDIRPDFYSGSAHKWPCGPKETGVLFVNKDVQSKLSASVISAYKGHSGIAKTVEGLGQRDEPAIIAFGESLNFQTKIGRKVIENRSRELTQALIQGLQKIDGIKLWTNPALDRSVAIVSFQPGNLDVPKLSKALYSNDRIACAPRGGADRGGLRFSPHFYNSHREVERVLAAMKKYMASGV